MTDVTEYLTILQTMLFALAGVLVQLLAAGVALVHLLDWLDDRWPALRPYTARLTDPVGTLTGGRRQRYSQHDDHGEE